MVEKISIIETICLTFLYSAYKFGCIWLNLVVGVVSNNIDRGWACECGKCELMHFSIRCGTEKLQMRQMLDHLLFAFLSSTATDV